MTPELKMVEEDLTTGRFGDCEKQAAAIDDASFPGGQEDPEALILAAMKLACQSAARDKATAQETEWALSSKIALLAPSDWDFAGTRHFLASSPAFATGRASWIALFKGLQDGDVSALAAALGAKAKTDLPVSGLRHRAVSASHRAEGGSEQRRAGGGLAGAGSRSLTGRRWKFIPRRRSRRTGP